LASEVLRTNELQAWELQAWFVVEHLVDAPLMNA
jgi:hypothetical protein